MSEYVNRANRYMGRTIYEQEELETPDVISEGKEIDKDEFTKAIVAMTQGKHNEALKHFVLSNVTLSQLRAEIDGLPPRSIISPSVYEDLYALAKETQGVTTVEEECDNLDECGKTDVVEEETETTEEEVVEESEEEIALDDEDEEEVVIDDEDEEEVVIDDEEEEEPVMMSKEDAEAAVQLVIDGEAETAEEAIEAILAQSEEDEEVEIDDEVSDEEELTIDDDGINLDDEVVEEVEADEEEPVNETFHSVFLKATSRYL